MKEYKGNHSQKLLEEVIQDVVGVLLVLAILLNIGVGIFLQNIYCITIT